MTPADHAATIRYALTGDGLPGDAPLDALAALVTQAERAVWLEDELDECDKRAGKAEARADQLQRDYTAALTDANERAERAETALRQIANANPAFGYDTFNAKWWEGIHGIARAALADSGETT